MGRTKKTETVEIIEQETVQTVVQVNDEVQSEAELENPQTEVQEPEQVIPTQVLKLMRLYPHYKRIWVTNQGFVHPEGVCDCFVKDATLYENKFYNN